MKGVRAAPAAFLVACGASESTPALYVPDQVEVTWDDAWNEDDDGLAMLVPLDVLAYDAATGAPIPELAVTLTDVRAWDEVGLTTDVQPLAVDEVRWRTEVSGPGDWWDARRDAYFDLSPRDGADPVTTDANGVARFYLLVDVLPSALPAGPGGFPVSAALGDVEETFLLVPR